MSFNEWEFSDATANENTKTEKVESKNNAEKLAPSATTTTNNKVTDNVKNNKKNQTVSFTVTTAPAKSANAEIADTKEAYVAPAFEDEFEAPSFEETKSTEKTEQPEKDEEFLGFEESNAQAEKVSDEDLGDVLAFEKPTDQDVSSIEEPAITENEWNSTETEVKAVTTANDDNLEDLTHIQEEKGEAEQKWESQKWDDNHVKVSAKDKFGKEDEDLSDLSLTTSFRPRKDENGELIFDEPDFVKKGRQHQTMAHNEFYDGVLDMIISSDDLEITDRDKIKIQEVRENSSLPQLAIRDVLAQEIVNTTQLARCVARTLGRKEITAFSDIPPESMSLKEELDKRLLKVLRENRIVPLWRRIEDSSRKSGELHLANDSATRDVVLENMIQDIMANYKIFWHFTTRDVSGAYWLSGSESNVDSNMEAEALLDRIIGTAIDARSSDIHIDPAIKGEQRAVVKYRIDGIVTPKEVMSIPQLERLKVRIENVAKMPKVNQNHPNKGSFSRAGYDWRVQIQPHNSTYGTLPRIVIRRLQPDVLPMEELGYPEYFIQQIKSAANAANGVILWTGPTGSGKTESIHSAVVSVDPMGQGKSVHTIEDPPEKRVPGYAIQMEMSTEDPARSGIELLKSSLRADPDVIIIGEIRDSEMAGLVFEAANTGHLVFSTLHTNTALDSITRLQELGVRGFTLTYIRGIASQRLVRRVCKHCREKVDQMDEFTSYIFEKYGVEKEGANLYRAHKDGCVNCNHTGYYGRIAIAEWLVPNKEIIEASEKGNLTQLEDMALRAGWKPMGYMGTLHLKEGITDTKELASKVLELSTEIIE